MNKKYKEQKAKWYQANKDRCNQKAKEWYLNNRERALSIKRAYYARHKERLAAESAEKYRQNPDSSRASAFKRRYGITLDQYNELLMRQNGCCAICNVEVSELKKNLAVDHDHKTNQVRGLLCFGCNVLLGIAKDSPDILTKSIEYLSNFIPHCKSEYSDFSED